jgi:hypothetical protein
LGCTILTSRPDSSNNWVYCTGTSTFEHSKCAYLFYSNYPHSTGAPSIRCIDLYGPREIDTAPSRWKFQYSAIEMDDLDFRDRRCDCVRNAGSRYVSVAFARPIFHSFYVSA